MALVVSALTTVLCCCLCWLASRGAIAAAASDAKSFAALFIFGDSLLDPGNDKKLLTLARADRPPYGRDLGSHLPTGRFCDGLLTSDFIASYAGLPYPPPYLLQRNNFIHGTSFASSGAGIMNLTGYQLLQRINFFQQVAFFADVKQQMLATIGPQASSALLAESLFTICLGSNDYLTNYFGNPFGQSKAQKQYTPEQFRSLLISIYKQNLLKLYSLGARKFALVSLSAVGCVPLELLLHGSSGGQCVSSINDEVQRFNQELLGLRNQLQSTISDAFFVYLNSFDMAMDIIKDPTSYGFLYSSKACCGSGPYNAIPCYNGISSVCENASEYVFWDFAHPTQAANQLSARVFWGGEPPQVYPYNLQVLASL